VTTADVDGVGFSAWLIIIPSVAFILLLIWLIWWRK
jgi:hypothetical protein